MSFINRYPDSNGFYLKKRLAKYYNIEKENIVLGNGSDELIDIILKTFVEDDEHILTADFTFLEYSIISKVKNRTVLTVPLKYFRNLCSSSGAKEKNVKRNTGQVRVFR